MGIAKMLAYVKHTFNINTIIIFDVTMQNL